MRKLRRPPASPPTLSPGGKGALAAGGHERQRTASPGAVLQFPAHWNEPDVRGALYAMHGRVCCYCQCNLPHNDVGDVEHFRPKAHYWWLAYRFDNYLLSCAACNRNRKREKFPLLPGSTPIAWADRDRLSDERPLLLNPVADDVEAWLRVDYQDALCPVQPTGSLATEAQTRAMETLLFFKLNENALLVRQRIETTGRALEAIQRARNGDQAGVHEVRRMASRFRPHGFAVRQMLTELAPDLLPSKEEDLLQLVLDFVDDLHLASKLLAVERRRPLARRFRSEALWALAVLWKHPPAGSPDLIESCLQKTGWRDDVAPLLNQI